MDASSLLQSLGAAVLSGGGSLVTALHSAAKHYKELKSTVEDLETKYKKLSEDVVLNSSIAEFKRQTVEDLKRSLLTLMEDAKLDLQQRLESIRRGFRLELDNHKDDLERKFRDVDRSPTFPGLTTVDELRRRLELLENRLDRVRDEHGHFVKNEAFSDFTEEQGRQWNEMNRTLGSIMGALKK